LGDIKYGIKFLPLDAILVPDFGQTKFDNAILNLEPFEQSWMKTGRFLQKELIYSTLEIYFLEELENQATDVAANEEVTN
jgi:hypothetical protein